MPWPLIAAAAIPAVAGLTGSLIQGNAAKNAADAELDELRRQFDLQREDFAPYREAGYSALDYLMPGLAPGQEFNQPYTQVDWMQDPGYQFRLQEGMKALERQQSRGGNLMGGRAMREMQRYGQDLASQEYGNAFNRYQADLGNRFNRLALPTQFGQTAVAQGATVGNQLANAMAGAQSGGITGPANAWAAGLGGVGNAAQNAISAYNQQQQNNMFQEYLQGLRQSQQPYNPFTYGSPRGSML